MSADHHWTDGERVLAQWEPGFLYVGNISEIDGQKVLIQFADGDAGWVAIDCLQPFTLQVGQDVMTRRQMGPHFFPGVIREIDGDEVLVDCADGREEWATLGSLRIRCEPRGEPVEVVASQSHFAFLNRLREGDRVWAVWNNAAFFPGTVGEFNDQQVHVQFDDGDQAWVFLADLLPLDIIPGMPVMCRRRSDPQFHPGTIADSEGERILVRFADDSEEWTSVSSLALRFQ